MKNGLLMPREKTKMFICRMFFIPCFCHGVLVHTGACFQGTEKRWRVSAAIIGLLAISDITHCFSYSEKRSFRKHGD